MKLRGLLLTATLLAGGPAAGGELFYLLVEHEQQRYGITINAIIDSDPQTVLGLLTDYPELGRLNASVREATVLDAPANGVERVRVVTQLCVLLLVCKSIVHVQDFERPQPYELVATIVGEGSDFTQGWARWLLIPDEKRTRIVFSSELTPRFWIPPVVGPWIVKSMLKTEALETIDGLERRSAQYKQQTAKR